MNGDSVVDSDAGEISQGVFEDCAGVGDIEKVDGLGLKLDKISLWEAHIGNREEGAFTHLEGLHHPVGHVNTAFFGAELEDTGVRVTSMWR